MQSPLCAASEAPAPDSLLVRVGPLPNPDSSEPIREKKKRRRSESLSDITNREPRKKNQLKKKKKKSKKTFERPGTSALDDAVWLRIQSMIVGSKSLRNITRVTLAFFKEHELAQMRLSGLQKPIYPIVVPVSEVYCMLAPRKRRVYDVLHVLEGIGVLKRIHDKVPTISRFRGGQFLYFGRGGALNRLETIRQRAQGIRKSLVEVHPNTTQHEIDTALFKTSNTQATVESWPYLAATTASFLSFVLQNDASGTHSLGLLNRRLVEARLVCESNLSGEGRDSLLVETNRRVYDVVSVLASLNIVVMSSLSTELKKKAGRRQGCATPRKGVIFNKAIFLDSSLLRIGTSCSSHLASLLAKEKVKITELNPVWVDENNKEVAQETFVEDDIAVPPSSLHEDTPSMIDLFPDIQPSDLPGVDSLTEWWDVPLRDVLLRDALPPVDFLDWEIMQAISRSRLRVAGDSTPFVTSKECDNHLHDEVDLECHEQLHSV